MQPEGQKAEAIPTFDEFRPEFERYLRSSGCRLRAALAVMRVYDELRKSVGGIRLDSFTPRLAAHVKAGLRRHRAPRGVDAAFHMLGRVFAFAVARQLIDRPPFHVEQFLCQDEIDVPLTPKESDALLRAAEFDARAVALVLFGMDAGLQGAEMEALRPGDVDLAERLLYVRRAKVHRSDGVGCGATPFSAETPLPSGRVRTVPLTRRLHAAISVLGDGPTLLTDDRGRPTTHNTLRPWLMAIRATAGLDRGVGLDHFRLSFATRLARIGTPAHVLRALTGCSARYWPLVAKVTLDQKRDAIAALERADEESRRHRLESDAPAPGGE